jgi:hypothetical protein
MDNRRFPPPWTIEELDDGVMGIAGSHFFHPSPETYLGFVVPGVVTTPIRALSSHAAMAFRIRAQNASSISK